MTPKSLDLKPASYSFFQSQFTKPVWPSKETSLAGATAIITGGNSGIGFAGTRALLSLNLRRLIIAVRTPAKGEAAASTLREKFPNAKIDVWQIDMLSFKSIQAFAEKCKTLDRLDLAILNAGTAESKFKKSSDGHETTFQVNYLSTVLLASLLLPILKQKSPSGRPGRLSLVNSGTSLAAKFPMATSEGVLSYFDDETTFNALTAYARSKALAHFWILKLAERVKPEDVVVNLVDPGLVKGTSLDRNFNFVFNAIVTAIKFVVARTKEQGASTFVNAAVVQGKESHGCYIQDWKIFPYTAPAYGEEGRALADRIWDETLDVLSFADIDGVIESLSS
ncbi:hypothetical protein FZEAL_5846 [Fusarium zealandicum]|uniref:Short-chain dehydrogenase/reductase family protein n=1 Tax=Fusarium zealandicum TaxID=1053134 RepID=A0A8H4UIW1_9HYPO|nr:hypothetical protein FZEAL_5846 [Fusarium zealandicum]